MTWIVLMVLLLKLISGEPACPEGYGRAPYPDPNVVKCVQVEPVREVL